MPIILPDDDVLQLDRYFGRGLQPDESELLDDEAGPPQLINSRLRLIVILALPDLPNFNEVVMSQLEAMGFSAVRCQKALLATGNNDAEAAMEWLFAHMEDTGTFVT